MNNVIIKSFRNGIALHLDETMPFDELLPQIAAKFKEAGSFFKDAQMALSFEGRLLRPDEERAVLDTICAHSDISIFCIVKKDEDYENDFDNALKILGWGDITDEIGTRFIHGSIRSGNSIECDGYIVVMGDVHPGAALTSTAGIIVLGGLYGVARVGAEGFVFALEMSPEQLFIGTSEYLLVGKGHRWSHKMKLSPKIARMGEGQVEIKAYAKGVSYP